MTLRCHSFALRAIARKVTARYDAALDDLGLNAEQLSLLSILASSGPMSIGRLAQTAYLDRSTVGRNVRVLNANSWTEYSHDGEDRRVSIIALTAEGDRTVREAEIIWAHCQEEVEQVFSPELLVELRAALGKFP